MHTWGFALASLALLGCAPDTFGGDASADGSTDGSSGGGDASGGDGSMACPWSAITHCADAGVCNTGEICCAAPGNVECRSSGGCSGAMLDCFSALDCVNINGDGGVACCLTGATIALACPAALVGGTSKCVGVGMCSGTKLCRSDLECGTTKTCKRGQFTNTNVQVGLCE